MILKEVFAKVAVALDETDLKEYQHKIYPCVDSVQREIAVFILPIIKNILVESLHGELLLPEDCFEVIGVFKGTTPVSFSRKSHTKIAVRDGLYTLRYNAYPQPITEKTDLLYSLEIGEEGAEALIYGVCAGLCINDEPALYTAYMDRYNGILEAITSRRSRFPYAEITGGVSI